MAVVIWKSFLSVESELFSCFARALGHPNGSSKPEAYWSGRNYRISVKSSQRGLTATWIGSQVFTVASPPLLTTELSLLIHMVHL